MYPKNDDQFQDKYLKEVKEDKDGYTFTFDNGWSWGIDKKSGIVPKVGDQTRCYGKGIGYTIRGFFVNGKKVFYRTEKQEEQRHKDWYDEERKKKEQKFIDEKEDRDRRIKLLSDSMQKRLQGFFERNKDFRIEYEPYELFCLEQAVVIARTLRMKGEIDNFSSQEFEVQIKMVPGISDQHSGNTFGFSCLMAKILLSGNDEYIIKNHGAMCHLVGCEEYGCWSTTQKNKTK